MKLILFILLNLSLCQAQSKDEWIVLTESNIDSVFKSCQHDTIECVEISQGHIWYRDGKWHLITDDFWCLDKYGKGYYCGPTMSYQEALSRFIKNYQKRSKKRRKRA